jgi:hypothetical protein
MGEILDMENKLRARVMDKVEETDNLEELVKESEAEWHEWAEARGINSEELETLLREKADPMVLSILAGNGPKQSLVAMAMYGFHLAFEVAAHRYLSDVPGVASHPPKPSGKLQFTKTELALMHKVGLAIYTGTNPRSQLNAEEILKLNDLRIKLQKHLEGW